MTPETIITLITFAICVALFIVSVNVIESGFVSGFVVLFCIPSILILGVTHADHVAQIEQKKKSIERATRRAQSVCMHFSEFQSLGLTIETDFFGGRVNCISFKK